MSTIINTPPSNTDRADSGAGWAVAIIILLAVIGIGAYLWVRYYRVPPAAGGGTNINVTLPPVSNSGNTP